jgi:hypothetical protein
MKKCILILATVVLTVTAFSCTKQDINYEDAVQVDPTNNGKIKDRPEEE